MLDPFDSAQPAFPPEPPVSEDTTLFDVFPDMPLKIRALESSVIWKMCRRDPDIAFYVLNLWMAAWKETPVGALPSNDDELKMLADCTDERWPEVRARVMRGWTLHSDGRLYHGFLSGIVIPEALDRVRDKQRSKANHAEYMRERRRAEREERQAKIDAIRSKRQRPQPQPPRDDMPPAPPPTNGVHHGGNGASAPAHGGHHLPNGANGPARESHVIDCDALKGKENLNREEESEVSTPAVETRVRASDSTPPPNDNPPPRPFKHLRRSEKRWFKWACYTRGQEEVNRDGVKQPVVGRVKLSNRTFLPVVIEEVCKAAEVYDPDFACDWGVLVKWFDLGGRLDLDIIPAIKTQMREMKDRARAQGEEFGGIWSLKIFDRDVRRSIGRRLKRPLQEAA